MGRKEGGGVKSFGYPRRQFCGFTPLFELIRTWLAYLEGYKSVLGLVFILFASVALFRGFLRGLPGECGCPVRASRGISQQSIQVWKIVGQFCQVCARRRNLPRGGRTSEELQPQRRQPRQRSGPAKRDREPALIAAATAAGSLVMHSTRGPG